ncbi:hypothetical protein HBE96_03315 [Clostridium sp. P21]|uniref:Uncharacterized protein n=1 Tax=Clostridium muellerianum TaxID=2716538 RepID=A0A7Y0EDZ7_9CLOT|nr:hypothetical protein [Clostridium muellerianum]NMM61734.1 hypothetical protein [Clostridium muellerianum]
MIIIIMLIFIAIVSFDVPELLKVKKKAKVLAIYFVFTIINVWLSVLIVLDKAPLSPSIFIEKVVKFIF